MDQVFHYVSPIPKEEQRLWGLVILRGGCFQHRTFVRCSGHGTFELLDWVLCSRDERDTHKASISWSPLHFPARRLQKEPDHILANPLLMGNYRGKEPRVAKLTFEDRCTWFYV
jgi:hypothetical protein